MVCLLQMYHVGSRAREGVLRDVYFPLPPRFYIGIPKAALRFVSLLLMKYSCSLPLLSFSSCLVQFTSSVCFHLAEMFGCTAKICNTTKSFC